MSIRRSVTGAVLLLLLGALGAPAARDVEAAGIKVVFPTTPTTQLLPHYVAEAKGYFKRVGLDVETITVTGDANAIRAVVSGQGDVAGAGNFPIYGAIENGAKIKAIGAWQAIVDYQLVAQTKFRTLKELEGSRLSAASIGGITTVIPEMLFEKHGLDPKKIRFISVGGHDARLKAVIADKTDATIVSTMFAAIGPTLGPVHTLVSIAKEFPGMGYSYLIATEAALGDPRKRQALDAYVQAGVIEGSRFIVENPDEAAAIMKTKTPETDLELIRAVIRELNASKVWGINGGLEPEVSTFTIDLARRTGGVKGALPVSAVIDRSLVESGLAKVGTK
jgi:NitT/TauT family transport system substrate-binding protein